MKRNNVLIATIIILYLCGCSSEKMKQFTDVSSASGIDFANNITESAEQNIFTYEYMYNGAGVAVGDINNDGLTDLFFTANQLPCKLYLNRGDLKFDDITTESNIVSKDVWKTGTSMADVNGDGLLDIYVCYSGNGDPSLRSNQLFINQGIKDGKPFFEEQAKSYGLDAPGTNSTQSTFFDFDRDGDLDMFLLNHATKFYSPLFNTYKLRHKRHPYFSNYLYRNDNGHFVDVSETSLIPGGGNNFGLGVVASDINNDGWTDLYMTNDYEEQDFLLLNNHDGTFREVTQQALKHISKYGMGCDVADYNNDGLMDIVVPDMLPADNLRQKLLRGPDEYDKYNLLVDSGYMHQNMRNTLQLNCGIGNDSIPQFSEIGQLANVSNTDWSWSSLFADFDNDGNKDLFVTNGYWRDYTNMDFQSFTVADYKKQYGADAPWINLVEQMPQTKISNYMFCNKGDVSLDDCTKQWGLDKKSVSHGTAYADLDNDGDLDLIINNMGGPAAIYRNNNPSNANYLSIQLKGLPGNSQAIGTVVTIETTAGKKQWIEQQPVRGYLSSVDPIMHVGLGQDSLIRSLTVRWPNGKTSVLNNVPAGKRMVINEATSTAQPGDYTYKTAALFADVSASSGIDFIQQENKFVDFNQEKLLPWQLSKQGPSMAKADVNGDGLEDVFIGAPSGQAGCLYIQTKEGNFNNSNSHPWKKDSLCEDTQSAFLDVDGDKDQDLYVVSGGNENQHGELLQDRIYLNDGKGNFTKGINLLPAMPTSKSCIAVADFDKDGRPDIFIGGSVVAGKYGVAPVSYLLKNETSNGEIKFTNVIQVVAPALQYAGMTTSAIWTDINNDKYPDLVVAGQWMPVKVFINAHTKLEERTSQYGLASSNGLWTCIVPADIDHDGDEDYLLGNLAPNTQFKASAKEPMTLCVKDFYNTGTSKAILCYYIGGQDYPYASRDEIADVMPMVKKRFLKYYDYAIAKPIDIMPADQQKNMATLHVNHLKNAWIENVKGSFVLHDLPEAAQFSPIQGAIANDFNHDGITEIFAAGNFFPFRVQLGREDGGKGMLLSYYNNKFSVAGYEKLGLFIDGDIRDVKEIKTNQNHRLIVITKNNGKAQVIKYVTSK